jgi:hypothetical protein
MLPQLLFYHHVLIALVGLFILLHLAEASRLLPSATHQARAHQVQAQPFR